MCCLHNLGRFTFCQRSKRKTPPTERHVLSRTNNTLIRGATLIYGMTRTLSRIPTYPRQITSACNVAEYFVKSSHLTAPSAVHLTTCFSPDSQHRRLSVEASLPLSPLQRFTVLNLVYDTTLYSTCQQVLKNIFPLSGCPVRRGCFMPQAAFSQSQPKRERPSSRVLMVSRSCGVREKPRLWRFSSIRSRCTDLGMTAMPFCVR